MPRFVRAKPLRTGVQIVRLIVMIVLGVVLGVISAGLRASFNIRGVHWEMLGALAVLLLTSLIATASYWRARYAKCIMWLEAEHIALWQSFALAWCITYGRFWQDMLTAIPPFMFACMIVGPGLLALCQWLIIRPIVGPYCPKCGYHLIRLIRPTCPECGRPFTIEELRVKREELEIPEGADW